jgi:hypothetical protein
MKRAGACTLSAQEPIYAQPTRELAERRTRLAAHSSLALDTIAAFQGARSPRLDDHASGAIANTAGDGPVMRQQ